MLEPGGEDPYFWASKLHFYITGITFYNFPYTFGYLLSRGLYAMFKKEGASFLPKYEEFLRLRRQRHGRECRQANRGTEISRSRISGAKRFTVWKSRSAAAELLPKSS